MVSYTFRWFTTPIAALLLLPLLLVASRLLLFLLAYSLLLLRLLGPLLFTCGLTHLILTAHLTASTSHPLLPLLILLARLLLFLLSSLLAWSSSLHV